MCNFSWPVVAPALCINSFDTVSSLHPFRVLYFYSYEADAQDKAEGVLKMHRRVTSKDVEDYASYIPGDGVALDKEEDIVYKKGVLTHSAGVSSVKMMPHNMVV